MFWGKIKKPIYALAPMAGITDSAFRQTCKSFGADVVYSEMASVAALSYAPEKTLEMLTYNKTESPYVVQLFGSQAGQFEAATKLVEKKIKPQGIDINFGCPVKKVQKQGAGAVLMNDLKLSREIIKAVIANTNLPVSIKLRSQVGRVNALKFLDQVNNLNLAAIMIHGRSMSQGFSGVVDWQIIKQARNYFDKIILANGGVKDYQSAFELLQKTKADGLGIAQGSLGNPWIFWEIKNNKFANKKREAIYKIAIKQAELIQKIKGKAGIIEMRKHLCWYVKGLPGASKLRQEIIKIESLVDIKKIIG